MEDSTIDTISIVILLVVLALHILFRNQFHGGIFLLSIGVSIIIFGSVIWLIGKNALGNNFTKSVHPKGLVTSGIYSKIRHPMYFGGMMIYIGMGLLLKSWIGLALTIILVIPMLLLFAKKEDKLLLEKYKEKYSAYRTKTIF